MICSICKKEVKILVNGNYVNNSKVDKMDMVCHDCKKDMEVEDENKRYIPKYECQKN